MTHRCAILDDYQNVATKLADWSIPDVEIKVFNEPFANPKAAVAALKGFSIICMMRERTQFLKPTLEQLPDLKLLITSGMRNASIDLEYAAERGITVCGTEGAGQPTAELAIGIMLELARKIGYENARMKQGVPWQSTLGVELAGKTLGLLGFGKLGSKVGEIGKAIGMKLIAWSQNLTEEKAKAGGAALVSKEELFRQSDFLVDPSPAQRAHARPRHREGSRADEADRVPDQHVARPDRRRALADGGARSAQVRRRRPRHVRHRAAAGQPPAAQARQCRAHPAPRLCQPGGLQGLLTRRWSRTSKRGSREARCGC